jgi:hypothetical protein
MVTIRNSPGMAATIRDALEVIGDALGVDICWYYCGDFHFQLAGGWSVSITPESAERLCVETWFELRLRDRKWARSGDFNRLRALVLAARYEAVLDPA